MQQPAFQKIADFRRDQIITGFFLVKNLTLKTSPKNNRQYGDYQLADQTGEINAKLWEVADPTACPDVGSFIKVQGLETEYQGKPQLRIDRMRLVTEEDPVDMGELVPSAPEDSRSMLKELGEYIERIEDEQLHALVEAYVAEVEQQLPYYPAALRNHHSIRAGLVYHTLSMLRMADGVLAVYPFLRRDLLFAGVIIHDLAKTEELDAKNTGIATQYTREGALLGHITQGIVLVDRLGRQLDTDTELVTLLEHMILSHHYEPEFGSPKRPMFPEAEVLHYLDILDARMYDFQKIEEGLRPGEFSEPVWLLQNRKLYKPQWGSKTEG